ncbi:protein of unknown function [Hyphomicrobium sp. MC1]|nr:protein of unknown function [Hyphomicrobium sp. MC1]
MQANCANVEEEPARRRPRGNRLVPGGRLSERESPGTKLKASRERPAPRRGVARANKKEPFLAAGSAKRCRQGQTKKSPEIEALF